MNILVVYAHPDPESFCAAVGTRVVGTFERRGHVVRMADLYADGFDPSLSEREYERQFTPGVDPELQRYADDLRWCEALVFVYPTWWSSPPAMLKGWMDRVWVNGVAWELPDGASRLAPRLQNVRRLVAVTTNGSSKLVNAMEGEAGKRMVTRTLRAVCHPLVRTKWVALYGVDTASARRRDAFLDRVARVVR